MTQTAMDGSKALPEEQWKKYQLMTGESRERLECRGVLLRCLDEAAREEKHQAEEMKRDIVDLVDMYRMDNAFVLPRPGSTRWRLTRCWVTRRASGTALRKLPRI
ncbi:uncharacterized protein LOC126991092 isoform X2 [Eriocheir sinensis]|uniref:uncharacterized protein LOC126991092 isoform X2 n=1 Tax=Eriocheir sinensis TaxID=95602 RepID=UPI0021C5CC03|nr:uncharacterized protein LOC126991092 isoform X2 [Eriocheir sinensis]